MCICIFRKIYLLATVGCDEENNNTDDDGPISHTSTILESVEVAPGTYLSGTYNNNPDDYLHFKLEMDINKRLIDAGVYGTKTPTRINFDAVRDFELSLKSGDWLDMTGPHINAIETPKTFVQQFREFLGNFFDKNVELNDIAGNFPSIVQLDDDKIRAQLTKTCGYDTSIPLYFETTGAFNPEAGRPVDPECLGSHLMSVRQLAQVLEAFGTFGVSSSNSRLKIVNDEQYVLDLHDGDSIIAETNIVDKDGLPGNQYTEKIKIQFIQKSSCPYQHPSPVTYVFQLEMSEIETPIIFTRMPNEIDFKYNNMKAIITPSSINNIGNLRIYENDSNDIVYSSYGSMHYDDIRRINQLNNLVTILTYKGSSVQIEFIV